ncbi:MAG: tripartite tricarboxylate transporter substrate binding protein [Betaproteobacteria bacterium]|nr:tripartite tricarboxylate transporter substrate binding protein [Betaproteobacteria bacterium]
MTQPPGRARCARLLACALIATLGAGATAHAQRADDYPTRAVRVIIPFAPGGPPDVIGRPLLQKLSEGFNQPFLFDNRPGASGTLGSDFVAKSAKDGYTLLYTTGSHNTNTLLIRKLPYDAKRDFQPISQITLSYGQLMVVHPSLPAKDLKTFIALARSAPGKLHFGSAGVGNITHLHGEMLMAAAALKMTHVPYKGASLAQNDLLGGHIEVMFPSLSQIGPLINNGRVRAIALGGPVRAPLFPNVPTFAEFGYPQVDTPGWQAMWAPAGTPRERIAKLNAEIMRIIKSTDMRTRIEEAGLRPIGSSVDEFTAFIERDFAFFEKAIRTAKIEAQ